MADQIERIANCFLCGDLGLSAGGYTLKCTRHPEGIVTWVSYDVDRGPLPKSRDYGGHIVEFIDFSKPDAPISPG
jgi:hypothetical protein